MGTALATGRAEGIGMGGIDMNRSLPTNLKAIHLHSLEEVEYWKSRFGVSEHDLRGAMQVAGNSPVAVEAQLRKRAAENRHGRH